MPSGEEGTGAGELAQEAAEAAEETPQSHKLAEKAVEAHEEWQEALRQKQEAEAEVGGDGWEDLAGSWRVRVHWTGEERRMQAAGNLVSTKRDSAWVGRVVARNAARGLHRVRYDDGAEELADLGIISFDTLAGEPS